MYVFLQVAMENTEDDGKKIFTAEQVKKKKLMSSNPQDKLVALYYAMRASNSFMHLIWYHVIPWQQV